VSYFEREEGEEGFKAVKRANKRRGGEGESTFEEECQATVVLAPNICYLRVTYESLSLGEEQCLEVSKATVAQPT